MSPDWSNVEIGLVMIDSQKDNLTDSEKELLSMIEISFIPDIRAFVKSQPSVGAMAWGLFLRNPTFMLCVCPRPMGYYKHDVEYEMIVRDYYTVGLEIPLDFVICDYTSSDVTPWYLEAVADFFGKTIELC